MSNKKSIGKVSESNKRIGEWKYYNDTGDIIAKGSYIDGLKKGVWIYNKKTYNNDVKIDWDIISNDIFKINLPKDWELQENENSITPIVFIYKDSISANGNITLIEKEVDEDINSVLLELTDSNKSNSKDYKILSSEKVEINGLESLYLQQSLQASSKDLFIEQYLIKNTAKKYYLVSFFTERKSISKYHQLFSEIAYSFTLLNNK